ncbi:hypothetical protein halTADL_2690 [Halohasta litchfieldiae]|jgi:hypothetical protein|uniref:Uncharacterized protein n=1 Tax=Halohasta litchfieldiae TaxID=1073996 RepID=A0A1H6VKI8_9EURY|nr:hypothetical protein [Halohasta litchfieldiae]ATW89408.1 hypothetical protein halTADL_2690 [Halohasta litchfieldiae]SEJ05128.1 hypothetical protein SAMN05444271_11815 [Halohasta litchfieldiae]
MVLRNPAVRWGIGISGGLMIAVISFLFLTGITQLVGYLIALFDAVITPLVLKQAAAAQ